MKAITRQEPILQLWAYPEAPPSYRTKFPQAESRTWIAYVPRELVDDPLALWLMLEATPDRPLSQVRLEDGSLLLSGALRNQTTVEQSQHFKAARSNTSDARAKPRDAGNCA